MARDLLLCFKARRMTTTPALDRISDQPPADQAFDASGDPIDDFVDGAPSWPTLDLSTAEPGHGQQVGRATQPSAADDVPAADSAPDSQRKALRARLLGLLQRASAPGSGSGESGILALLEAISDAILTVLLPFS